MREGRVDGGTVAKGGGVMVVMVVVCVCMCVCIWLAKMISHMSLRTR